MSTATIPIGLTTNKAPFIEQAQQEGRLYIHQPYALYSEANHDAWRKLLMPANNSARLPATARAARSRPASPRTSQNQRRHLTINVQPRIAQGVGRGPR